MKAKCERCGMIYKFPFQIKNQWKMCYRCKGRLQIKYTNKQEFYLEKKLKFCNSK